MKNNIFNQIKVQAPGRNIFNLSHDHKLSLKMGKLVPFYVQECIPTDSFQITTQALLRLAPMIAPVMHKMDVYFHFFFVPNRILWDNFEKWISETDNENYQPPFAASTISNFYNINKGSTGDYMGLPITTKLTEPINILPLAAYARIYQEYYQDQNNDGTFAKDPIKLQDGLVDKNYYDWLMELKTRAWEHDYFTSALPWAQKGDAVNIPLSLTGSADISYKLASVPQQLTDENGDPIGADVLETDNNGFMKLNDGTSVKLNVSQLQADLEDQALTGTINDLRRAMAIQKWLEVNARSGTRYKELLVANWGDSPSDARLQRPEYIGGSKQPVMISEVLQTSQTTEDAPQGNMSGHGVSAAEGNQFEYYCKEHGYIIGIMSVLPTTAYFQGIPRHFSRLDQLDYPWPQFNNIGEQEIKLKELYYEDDETEQNNSTFGYIPRYAELRYNPSRVSGDFRDNLLFWHMARKFDNPPQLNADFIYANPTKRIFAVEDEEVDELYAHIYLDITAKRPIPLFGTPLGL